MIQLAKSRRLICHALSYPWFRDSDEAKRALGGYCLNTKGVSTLLGLVKVSPKELTRRTENSLKRKEVTRH
jgi:hypothetical protein